MLQQGTLPQAALSEAIRILGHDATELALRHWIYATGPDGFFYLNDLAAEIEACARAVTTRSITKKDAAKLAAALRLVQNHNPELLTNDIDTVATWIRVYDILATDRKPGRKSDPSYHIIPILTWTIEGKHGRPLHEVTAALLQATFPKKKWTAARVAEHLSRRKPLPS